MFFKGHRPKAQFFAGLLTASASVFITSEFGSEWHARHSFWELTEVMMELKAKINMSLVILFGALGRSDDSPEKWFTQHCKEKSPLVMSEPQTQQRSQGTSRASERVATPCGNAPCLPSRLCGPNSLFGDHYPHPCQGSCSQWLWQLWGRWYKIPSSDFLEQVQDGFQICAAKQTFQKGISYLL